MLQSQGFPLTSPTLLADLRDGSGQSAWREFFRTYAPAIYRVGRLRGLSAEDAEDIVQQVMVVICGHISTFRYDTDRGRFRQWVRRITEYRIINLARRQRPVARDSYLLAEEPCEQHGADEVWEQQWQLQDMLFCVEQVAADVSPRRMKAFRMYALEGKTATETAETVGMTVGYV